MVGAGAWKVLFLLLNFSMNLKLLSKIFCLHKLMLNSLFGLSTGTLPLGSSVAGLSLTAATQAGRESLWMLSSEPDLAGKFTGVLLARHDIKGVLSAMQSPGPLTSSDTLNLRSSATTFCLKFCCCKTRSIGSSCKEWWWVGLHSWDIARNCTLVSQ